MRYRDARNLKSGDFIIRKADQVKLTVDSVELLGQFKTAVITCLTDQGNKIRYYNHEVDSLPE